VGVGLMWGMSTKATNQPRQPRGVPTGGQWRATRRPLGNKVAEMDEPDSLGAWVGRATGRLRWTRWPDDTDEVVRLRAGTGLDGDDGASLWAQVEDRGDDGYVWSIHRREMGAEDAALIASGSSSTCTSAVWDAERAVGSAQSRLDRCGWPTPEIPDDPPECEDCGVRRKQRVCESCGVSAELIDCGHYGRPEIAGDSIKDYCDTCWEQMGGA
jgi:hypothetical protein